MTKLSSDNLQLRPFRDCLSEPDDRQFVNSINSYLDQFRQRLFAYFTYMKSDTYREHIKQQLDNEMELNKALKAKVHCLETNIKILLDDAIQLLKLRTNELGIEELTEPAQLISYANDISNKHKELRSRVASLEKEIAEYDHDNDKLNFILANIQTNGHSSASSASDNTYSILLANMSRQTQQQEFSRQSETLEDLPEYSTRVRLACDPSLDTPCLRSSFDPIVQHRQSGTEARFLHSKETETTRREQLRWPRAGLAD